MAYISTMLSILALLAVSVSLVYQAHQARIAQMVGSRERHVELMRLMLEYPELNYQKMADPNRPSEEHLLGMCMWMSHWNTMWHIKKLDERALRFVTADMFEKRSAREWWTKVGATWSSKSSRRERLFIEIVTAECNSASTSQQSPPNCSSEKATSDNAMLVGVAVLAGTSDSAAQLAPDGG